MTLLSNSLSLLMTLTLLPLLKACASFMKSSITMRMSSDERVLVK